MMYLTAPILTADGYFAAPERSARVSVVRRLTVRRIQDVVSAFYRIPSDEMTSERRGREVARPRQIAMYLAREMTPKSFPDIGKLFGNRDHTTVLHAVRRVESLIEADPDIAVDVEVLRERLAA